MTISIKWNSIKWSFAENDDYGHRTYQIKVFLKTLLIVQVQVSRLIRVKIKELEWFEIVMVKYTF